MSKDIVLIGSSSEIAIEFEKKIKDVFKIHKISSKKDSNPDLLVNDYIEEQEEIARFICNFVSNNFVLIIFFK